MKQLSLYLFLAVLVLGRLAAISMADPLDQWTLRSSGTSQTLRAVAYANNEFVAVGSGGTILTSPDGVTWTSRSSGTTQDILAITYGNGTFMAVGPGVILISADGTAWRSPASNTLPLNAVVYGDNSFLAVKTDSWPASGITSRDGITWTSLNLGFRLGGVAFGNHRFLACGEYQEFVHPTGTINHSLVYSSPDAITWTLTYEQLGGAEYARFGPIIYGNDEFLLVQNAAALWTYWTCSSPDGTKWTRLERADTPPLLNGTAFGAQTYVTVGAGGLIRTSPKGTKWTQRVSGTAHALYGITYGNDSFVAVGDDGTILQSGLFPSTPPSAVAPSITAQPQSQVAFSGADVTLSVAATGSPPLSYQWQYNGRDLPGETNQTLVLTRVTLSHSGAYAVVVNNPLGTVLSATALLQVSTPLPLDQWTRRASGTSFGLARVVYAQDKFLAVGDAGTILRSPDGVVWTPSFRGGPALSGLVYGDNQFVATGSGRILTSADGIRWSSHDLEMGVFVIFNLAYGNNTFIGVEAVSSFPYGIIYVIVRSSDGINWGNRYDIGVGNGSVPNAITYGANAFLAVGPGGEIRASPDGIRWTARTVATSGPLNDIAYGQNGYFAVGGNGTILSSPDGIAWTSRVSGTRDELRAVACGQNYFVAVGAAGTILSSPDGITWTNRRSGTAGALTDVAFGSHSFVAVGDGGLILQSAPLSSTLAPPVLSGRFNDGSFELTIAGTTGQSVSLQSADHLLGNIPWQTLVTLALTNSPVVWRDAPATNRPQRFYRAIAMP
jgi:photosystem II stability/assembly factor-like uncharacterized protein